MRAKSRAWRASFFVLGGSPARVVGERIVVLFGIRPMSVVTGPECPDCGCTDSQVVSESKWLSKVRVGRLCDFCGRVWKTWKQEPKDDSDAGPTIAPDLNTR